MDMHVPFPCLIVTNFSCKDSYGFETATWELAGSNFFFELKITSLSSFNKKHREAWEKQWKWIVGSSKLEHATLEFLFKTQQTKDWDSSTGFILKEKKTDFLHVPPSPWCHVSIINFLCSLRLGFTGWHSKGETPWTFLSFLGRGKILISGLQEREGVHYYNKKMSLGTHLPFFL